MNWSLTDKFIERTLLTTGLFSLFTLFFQALGWNQTPGSLLFFFLLSFAISCFTGISNRCFSSDEEPHDLMTVLSFWGFTFFGLISILFYYNETTGVHAISNPNINGDWPMHLNQTLFLAKTQEFWPANPILAGEPLRYAFGINWLTALFVKAQIPLQPVILGTGMLSILMTTSLLKRTFGAWGLWALFASGGGWGFGRAMLSEAWGPASQLAWKNLFLAVYMPQRGFWWALPCGLFLLRYLFLHWQERKVLKFPFSFVFLWAILPFFHLHSFVAISLFILVTVFHQRAWFSIFKFLPGIPLALFFIFKSVNQENAQGAVRWTRGWMTGSLEPMTALILNWGPWLAVLGVFSIYIFSRPGRRGLLASVLAMTVLFNFLVLAPWDWDQIKIMIWMYLALSYFMAKESAARTSPWVGVALMILIHAAGFLQLLGGLPSVLRPMTLWSLKDQQSVRQLMSTIPTEDKILIAPQPHHPLWSSGRAAVMGYEGHVWAHGVNTEGLKESLTSLFNGQEIQSVRFSKLSANYLLWGPWEKSWFGVEVPPEATWTKLNSVGDYSLYSRSQASTSTGN